MIAQLGKYRLIRLLAEGGMGEVFLARQEGPMGFAKPAVVKRMLPHLAKDTTFVEMFLNEARVAALVSHPNVVQIFELGEANGTYFIAMEFVHGRTLRALAKALKKNGEAFPLPHLARLASQALTGLHYAHTLVGETAEPLNIVHRDMSPDNIMLGFNGTVKVLDFGIAKAASQITTTRTGMVKGKFAYMPPEHLLGQPLDGRADLYAVAVILYEIIAGVRPYVAPSDPALINLILNEPFKRLSEWVPDVPAQLEAIIHRALEKNRDNRFENAAAMAAALEAFCATSALPLTSGSLAELMSAAFGAEAIENPAALTPTAERVLPKVLVTSAQTRFEQSTPSARKRRRQPLVVGALVGIAALVLGAWGIGRAVTPDTTPRVSKQALIKPVATAPRLSPQPLEAPLPAVEPVVPRASPQVAVVVSAPVAVSPSKTAAPTPSKPAAAFGKVDLRVNPYAEVFAGQRLLGTTPLEVFELPVGMHELTLKNDELNLERKVTLKVSPGNTTVLRVDLLE